MTNSKSEKIILRKYDTNLAVDCIVRKSKRARRISLRMRSVDTVVLTLPVRVSVSVGKQFLLDQEQWIRNKASLFEEIPSLFEYCDSGNFVWLDDTPREVRISSEEQRKRNNTWIDRDEIFFRLRFTENMETEILRECIKLAKEYLPKRLETCSSKVNLHPFSCRVGNQRTRWGSCSCIGVISLNWRIILLPYELGNYVLYHELAHLRELNHSTAFWNLLNEMIPDARGKDRELSKLGRKLMSLGFSE